MPFIPVLAEVEDQALSACQSSYSFSSEALRDFVLKKKKKQTKKNPTPLTPPSAKNKTKNKTKQSLRNILEAGLWPQNLSKHTHTLTTLTHALTHLL